MMQPINSEAKSSGQTPAFSSSISDRDFVTDDESSDDYESSLESPPLSIVRRNLLPRQSSLPNDSNQSPSPPGRDESTEDEKQYFEAYWAKVRQRRLDPSSLPLVPYTDELYGAMDRRNRYRAPPRRAQAYQNSNQRRPLIDFIHNEWKNNASTPGNPPNETNFPSLAQVITAPVFRRSALIIFLFWLLVWGNWKYWVKSQWEEQIVLNNALQGRFPPGRSMFGTNTRPKFSDMIHMRTINQDLIPQRGEKTRLVVVGDVHGCVDECTFQSLNAI